MPVVGSAAPYRTESWTCVEDEKGVKTYETQWIVTVDSSEDGPAVVLSASGLPEVNDAYSVGNDSDPNSWVISRSVRGRIEKHGLLWLVDVTYSSDTEAPKDENGQPSSDPASWRTTRTISFVSRQKEMKIAVFVENSNGKGPTPGLTGGGEDGVIVLNSALQPIQPSPLIDDQRLVITSTFYERNPDIERYEQYKDAVNNDQITIVHVGIGLNAGQPEIVWQKVIAPRTAKIRSISINDEEINNQVWPKVSVSIELDKEGWLVETPDIGAAARACQGEGEFQGWQEDADFDGLGGTISDLAPGTPRLRSLYDANGNVLDGQVALNGRGQPVDCGEPPNAIKWKAYPELPFNVLRL